MKNIGFNKFKSSAIISYAILIFVIFLSIGFSAFSNQLNVKDISASVRVNADIRITSANLSEAYNEAYSTSLDYNKTNINGTAILPNEDSYIDYVVKITNLGKVEMGIKEITLNNDNLDYELIDYNLGDKLCVIEEETTKCTLGIEKQIIVRLKWKNGSYDSSNTENNFILDFNFQNYQKVYIEDTAAQNISDCPSEVINTGDLTFRYTGVKFDIRIYMGSKRINDYTFENGLVTIKNVTDPVYIKYISFNIENGSFETPTINSSYSYVSSEKVVSWNTTSISNQIEVAKINNNNNEHLNLTSANMVDSTLPDGNQFAEINANEKASLFQNFSVTAGETYNWNLHHRGRGGQEIMALIIGNQQENEPKKANVSSNDQFNAMIKWLLDNNTLDLKVPTKKLKYKIYSPAFDSSGGFSGYTNDLFSYEYDSVHTEEWDVWIISSSNSKWFEYSDDYTPTSNKIIFALCSVLSIKSDLSCGNLIDKVSFSINNNEQVVNGSFDDLDISDKSYFHFNAENSSSPNTGIGWSTTAIDKKVEIGNFKKAKTIYSIAKDILTPYAYVKDGSNFIELNATETGTVYQNFLVQKDKTNEWSFAHRGRLGIDYMAMIIGPSQSLNPSKQKASTKDQFMKMIDWIKDNIDIKNYNLDFENEATGCSDKITIYTAKFSSLGSFEVEDANAISLTQDDIHTEKWNVWVIGSNNDDWYNYGFYDENLSYDNTYINNYEKEETIIAFTNYSTWGQRNNGKSPAETGNLLDYVNWR
ncbi:MAG: hypothetical protein UE699_00450 [Bacilli bacterium]|nr:hypothetical protein [Bacilli bacterium]